MSRQWKPGDVAMVRITRRDGIGESNEYRAMFGGKYGWWGVLDGEGVGGLTDSEKTFKIERRPLVVIDPEDREQVYGLLDRYYKEPYEEVRMRSVDNMQDALRSLVAEPKPEEPTGLGAIVADRSGVRYVSTGWAGPCWLPIDNGTRNALAYDRIDVVKVLSEGIER